ncbi:Anti-sigma regulatory factor (Ser/Thr protein kinase) [Jatrophihabitans endophyticus]|uniref:Anti-sigma regulatory factor (Ser/Thr protein kinase) n=1 Tax=Jatrophihabitans endophyticus TaxID=1206085 RepID=A0A1M5KX80_9ACTN|nr:ATP-binding protein [Jatrophihabitans endophyticus]SHG57280.1 Anti-sigma regulatory factor (Ser/Thr protein kinase) [Jatrophihabitans endophyticus]
MTRAERSERFAPELASVRAGRHFVRDTLEAWDLAELADDAQLCVSEIVTNAVTHAGTQVTVTVRSEDDLVVEVHDGVATLSVPEPDVPVAATATSGRGLQIVSVVSADWGVECSADGKVIWFRLPLPDTTARHHDADVLSLAERRSTPSAPPAATQRASGYEQARTAG